MCVLSKTNFEKSCMPGSLLYLLGLPQNLLSNKQKPLHFISKHQPPDQFHSNSPQSCNFTIPTLNQRLLVQKSPKISHHFQPKTQKISQPFPLWSQIEHNWSDFSQAKPRFLLLFCSKEHPARAFALIKPGQQTLVDITRALFC